MPLDSFPPNPTNPDFNNADAVQELLSQTIYNACEQFGSYAVITAMTYLTNEFIVLFCKDRFPELDLEECVDTYCSMVMLEDLKKHIAKHK